MNEDNVLHEGGKNCLHGNPLNLDHLSVDKMKIRDIIDNYEGVKHTYNFPQQEVKYHPV